MPGETMGAFNLSGTLSIFRLFFQPSLCLPHATVKTFKDLPIPLSKAFEHLQDNGGKNAKPVKIRAVVLDKDDCFARPGENEVFGQYKEHFSALRKAYPPPSLLIVSNTAGSSSDPTLQLSQTLTQNTGVPVLPHRAKKPGCGNEIMAYFRAHQGLENLQESEVAIVGDRLMTDMMLANTMGSWGVWVKDGVVPREQKTIIARMEERFGSFLLRRGYSAPSPRSPFE